MLLADLRWAYTVVLIARAVLGWAVVLAPAPPGPIRGRITRFTHRLADLVLAPPRRDLPPLWLGSVSVDLAFLVALMALQLARVAVVPGVTRAGCRRGLRVDGCGG